MRSNKYKKPVPPKYLIPALEDCPFCGGKSVIISHPGENWDGKRDKCINIGACHGLWYVGCPSPWFEGLVKDCEIHPAASWYANLEDAISDWNRRVKEGKSLK